MGRLYRNKWGKLTHGRLEKTLQGEKKIKESKINNKIRQKMMEKNKIPSYEIKNSKYMQTHL